MGINDLFKSGKIAAAKVTKTGATIKTNGDLTIAEAAALQNGGLVVTGSEKIRGERVYTLTKQNPKNEDPHG
jgi:uncharacterized protein with beta-barrel porin domain